MLENTHRKNSGTFRLGPLNSHYHGLILLLNKRFATTYVHAVLQLHVSDHDHRDEEIIEAYFESKYRDSSPTPPIPHSFNYLDKGCINTFKSAQTHLSYQCAPSHSAVFEKCVLHCRTQYIYCWNILHSSQVKKILQVPCFNHCLKLAAFA